jgi:hypothetical protein
MRNFTKINSTIFLIVLLTMLFPFNFIVSYASPISDIKLTVDSPTANELPKYFRKSTDKITPPKNINLSGLDKLNISGSGQFSKTGIPLMKSSIGNKFPITVIDLREESHGFIDGIPVSWKNANNDANKGLSLKEIVADENSRLNSIPLNKPVVLDGFNDVVIPSKVQNEFDLTKAYSLSYLRIPVTDGSLPTDTMVNYFMDIVKNQPENSWLHFHDKEGIGRTTTFMIMYDIMKNCKDVSLDDIITRQVLLSKMNEKEAKSFYSGNTFEFLSKFYNNCKSS